MKSTRCIFNAIAAATVAAAMASCNHHRQYTGWASLPEAGWAYGDTLNLMAIDTTLHANDSLVQRPLLLGIAHSNDYPYANLWLEVTYHGSSHYYRDTVNIVLADVYGRWLGTGLGTQLQHRVMLNPSADIDLTRPVAVRHIMRTDTLRGIDHIGIDVE